MKKELTIFWLWLLCLPLLAQKANPEFSTAGFFAVDGTGRSVYSMNPAWLFHKGAADGADTLQYDDSDWAVISLPHGIEYLPVEASGCVNYQGEAWYRKHFTPDASLQNKKQFLHFEGIMGKSKIYINGKLLSEHYGGYLPAVVDITDYILPDRENVIAVWTDNSDDPLYPPGKPQDVLDYTYFGGIYRDCWLVAHEPVYITDPNFENEVAGGGLFVAFDQVSKESADILLNTQVRNASDKAFTGVMEYVLETPEGEAVAWLNDKFNVEQGKAASVKSKLTVSSPRLWSPSQPELYNLIVYIRDQQGKVIDGYRRRIGIRSIEFKGKDGFWLNGEPYGKPVIGVNRHQDFAIVGNAVPNNMHWRDARKLKELGLEAIRNAHCPQDPAFMDACDELGLLVIVNTPGWQFWNDEPVFAERVYGDIRNLVRRDRNHPSVWMWEPILNETWYPADFAKKTRDIVDAEYPYPYCYSSSDSEARGHEHFPVHFAHPGTMEDAQKEPYDPAITYFTREWGDNVDDWNSHNSPSRVARNWGEEPMRIQANHYAHPDYTVTNFDVLYQQSPQHVGGCLWHSFDHQRGYHPDPFYGGIMDVFRQPKYSYYLFMAQRPADEKASRYGAGPMVFIAHEMTPFSGKDVSVYSNCDEVRLTFNKAGETRSYTKDKNRKGMPSPIIVFTDFYDFMTDKALSRDRRQEDVYLLAEGLIDGKVVATHKVSPSRRPEKLVLWLDNDAVDLKADGSDLVTVVAGVADKNGNIKRLNNYTIRFDIEGEGRIAGDESIQGNPVPVRW